MRTHGHLALRPTLRPRAAIRVGESGQPAAHPATATDMSRRARRDLLAVTWLPAIILVAITYLVLQAPDTLAVHYTTLCIAFAVGAVLALVMVLHRLGRPACPLAQRRLIVIGLGAAGGLLVPLALLLRAPSAALTATIASALAVACIFPLACTYAARTPDLFELNAMLRRTLTYSVVVASMGLAELTLLFALDTGTSHASVLLDGVQIALGNLILLLAVPPLHERLARAMKHRLTPQPYSPRQQLARLSDALGGAQTVEGVQRALADVLRHTVDPTHHHLYVEDQRGNFRPVGGADTGSSARTLPKGIAEQMHQACSVYRYRSDDGRSAATTALWTPLGADTVIPIFTGGITHAVLVLGGKRSGKSYHADDFAFLRAAAGQVALGLTNARAFRQLRQLNTTLERTVDERTAAERTANADLQSANADLERSIAELRQAYSQLEQNHACLLRADRLATLGRLTAGIAHEVNTPLSAVQNALKILSDLGQEYATSIDDPAVAPSDHQDIAAEIITTARAAAEWADKAARFIRGTKAHGRTAPDTLTEPFAVAEVVDEARTLLIHRLRVAGCTLECTEERPGISVVGDRSAFAQVVINLITNALDAYEDARLTNVRILVSIDQSADAVSIEVRDWAGGIPLQVLPRIFEELFTTKSAGRGTGLGLWISRTIVEKEFGGMLDVMSVPGEGSCFLASIPAAPRAVQTGRDHSTPSRQHAA